MAIGLKGLFGRGVGISGAALLGFESRGVGIGGVAVPVIKFSTQPVTTQDGSVMSTVVVTFYLSDGVTPDPTQVGNVTLAKGAGAATFAGSTLTVAAVAGVASFPNVIPHDTATSTNNTLVASSAGYTNVTSSTYTINVRALVIHTQPAAVNSGSAFSSAPVIYDTYDGTNPDTSSTRSAVTTVKTGHGTLASATVACVAGVATFTALTISDVLTEANVLTFTCGSLTVDSNSFVVTNAQVTTDWAALIAANGGASAWLIERDYRVGVTDSGSGTASAWAAVTAGKGNDLVQATQSKQYAITTGGLVGTAAAQSHMIAALNANLTMNQAAALNWFVWCKGAGANQYLVVLSQDPTDATSTPNNLLATNGTEYTMQFNPGSVNLDVSTGLGTLIGSTARMLMFGRQATHPSLGAGAGDVRFYGKAIGRRGRRRLVVNTPSATASGMKECVGRWGNTHADVTIMGYAATSQTMSKTLLTNLIAFGKAQYGCVNDDSTWFGYLTVGTSGDRAHNTTHPIGWNPAAEGGHTPDGTTSSQDACAKIVPTWASQHIEDNIYANTACANGHLITDDIALYAEDYALDTVDCIRGNKVFVIGGLLGTAIISPHKDAGGDITHNALIAGFAATLKADGWKVGIRTVDDYCYANGFITPSGNDAGSHTLVGDNMRVVNATQRALPTNVDFVMEFEHQALTRGEINRAAPFEGKNFAGLVLANYDATGHGTDLMHVSYRGPIERAMFDSNPSIMGISKVGSSRLQLGIGIGL